jgi:hypothetical protein
VSVRGKDFRSFAADSCTATQCMPSARRAPPRCHGPSASAHGFLRWCSCAHLLSAHLLSTRLFTVVQLRSLEIRMMYLLLNMRSWGRHEKTKKKRSFRSSGPIDMNSNSVKFESDSE